MEGLDAGPLPPLQLALDCSAAWLKLGLNSAVICMPAVCPSNTGEGKGKALILLCALLQAAHGLAMTAQRGPTFCGGVLLTSAPVVRGPPQDGPPAPQWREGCICFGGLHWPSAGAPAHSACLGSDLKRTTVARNMLTFHQEQGIGGV